MVSCSCYLSKTHFVLDFFQNSIGNSSTSTTYNPICSAGTILELQFIMEFHRLFIQQHHLQSHLYCGNDPTVTNHNEILSTTHARNTGDTPCAMRNRSEHDPTTHKTVSQPSYRRGRSPRFTDGLCMEKHHSRDRLVPVAPQRSIIDVWGKNACFHAAAISEKRILF